MLYTLLHTHSGLIISGYDPLINKLGRLLRVILEFTQKEDAHLRPPPVTHPGLPAASISLPRDANIQKGL